MKSSAKDFVKLIDLKKIDEAKEIVLRLSFDQLTNLLDEEIADITFSCRQGGGTLIQHLFFIEDATEVVSLIFKRLREVKSFLGHVNYAIFLVAKELEYRAKTHFMCNLDELDGYDFAIEYVSLKAIMKNLQTMLNHVDTDQSQSFIAKIQRSLDSTYLFDYRRAYNKEVPSLFAKYEDLFFEAYEQMELEFRNHSYQIENAFNQNGKMTDDYAEYLLKTIQSRPSLHPSLQYQSLFLKLCIDEDLFLKCSIGKITGEEILASIRFAMDCIFSIRSQSRDSRVITI